MFEEEDPRDTLDMVDAVLLCALWVGCWALLMMILSI